MAIVFVPVLGGMFGKRETKIFKAHRSAPRLYRNILKAAISYPLLVVTAVAAFMALSFSLYFSAGLGVTFFPKIEPEQAVIQVLARGDLAYEERDKLVQEAEKKILDINGLSAKYAKSEPANGQQAKDSIGFVRTIFDDWQNREKATVIMDEMRQKLNNLSGVRINVQAQEDGPGGGLPIHIEIYNDNLALAAKATQKVRDLMNEIGGFIDTVDSRPMPGIEWTLDFDRTEASRHGVSIDSLGNMVAFLQDYKIQTLGGYTVRK